MWEDALINTDEKVRTKVDITKCRKWLSIITSKLFEAQSALSRHRFKLSKRMKNPMYEKEEKLPISLKNCIIDQYQKKWLSKGTSIKETKEQREENAAKRRKLADNADTQNVNSNHKELKKIVKKVRKNRTKTPHKDEYWHNTRKMKLPMQELYQGDINLHKVQKYTDTRKKDEKTQSKVIRRPRVTRAHALSYYINPTGHYPTSTQQGN
jgi:hypothetical protein